MGGGAKEEIEAGVKGGDRGRGGGRGLRNSSPLPSPSVNVSSRTFQESSYFLDFFDLLFLLFPFVSSMLMCCRECDLQRCIEGTSLTARFLKSRDLWQIKYLEKCTL